MKLLSKISIAFTLLILLVFGTGGIGIAKCECSGKTSIVLPMERGCCPTESGCMTIKVAQISDYELIQLTDVPQPTVAEHETEHSDFGVGYYSLYAAADLDSDAIYAAQRHWRQNCQWAFGPCVPLVGTIVLRI